MQGYYDASSIPKESFDKTIQFKGDQAELSPELKQRAMRLALDILL